VRRGLTVILLAAALAACGRDAPPPEPEPVPAPPVDAEPPALSLRLTDYEAIEGWRTLDAAPALAAFRRSCARLADAPDDTPLNPQSPWAGTVGDWRPACAAAESASAETAAAFFERAFLPVAARAGADETGLLTGYYEPELSVRREATAEFSEPILARPDDLVTVDLGLFEPDLAGRRIVGAVESGRLAPYDPRAEIGPERADAIAWGRPADVFFLQVQGSGRLRFEDGTRLRAAFAAHNGLPYQSIGRVLVERGELTLDAASKASIEAWMTDAGADETRALMNANPRYVFFAAEPVDDPARGPRGAQGAPLTPMASLAVDTDFHPLGLPVLLETRIPQAPGDFEATRETLLVVAQDRGGAIDGPLRGDLFFGTGDAAGGRAGVMKHPAGWTLLLPTPLALALAEPAS